MEKMIYQSPLISADALDFLKKIIGENKTIVEIGCYKGGTTCALAEYNQVIAIDPFYSNYDLADTLQNMDGVEEAFKQAVDGKNVIWYKEKSENVLKWWKDEIDGVFIDGNHSELSVLMDIGWISFIRKGGIIAFHDYHCWEGVRNVVDKYIMDSYELIGIVDDLIIFRK